MKKLLFLFILFASSCKAQTPLYKIENGVEIRLSPTDSADFVNQWKANEAIRVQDSIATAKLKSIQSQIVTTAQSAVGVSITSLTAAQVRALEALLLWKEGAIDSALKIKPLLQWVK